ncbi:MAG: dTDP-4-dehydrorhamnose 3,5-epimerase family protein [Acidobacteriota bacterium]
MADFIEAEIVGVVIRKLIKYHDERGWLAELFRSDELSSEFLPQMAYVSLTLPGVVRGPHEHSDQADYFCFLGPSNFKVYLWDNRADSPSYYHCQTLVMGSDNPSSIIVPKGVVHAYQNVGNEPGLVFNCPNRLYRGKQRRDPVDEIRHETDVDTIFQLN